MRRVLLLVAPLLVVGAGAAAPSRHSRQASCPRQRLSASYVRRVDHALRGRHDIWGEALLRSTRGPTYEGARGYLKPLMLGGHRRGPTGRLLTDSGVYYVALGEPTSVWGAGSVGLHVADGSEILSTHVGGSKLVIEVGPRGRERYGACTARLTGPHLYAGYLPLLETSYRDSAGVRYDQESFAARIPRERSLLSFVKLTVTRPRGSTRSAYVRFRPSAASLRREGDRLVRGGRTHLFFSAGAHFDGSALSYRLQRALQETVYVAFPDPASPSQPFVLDQASYDGARSAVLKYWHDRLSQGTVFVVPEARVLNAERSLLIQNMNMAWRYSLGNDYDEFEFPESLDGAAVMGEYGFGALQRAIVTSSLRKGLPLYPNWDRGAEMSGLARYYSLFGDRAAVTAATPRFRRYLASFARQLRRNPSGLLARERYASDLPDRVYGLDSQAVAWQGLNAMARAWTLTGHPGPTRSARRLASELGSHLRTAVARSSTRLHDGSLFVPARLLDGESSYDALTASRRGSYWNLVAPYALASGLIRPHGSEARGVLTYMREHGSRFLGLVRAGAYTLYRAPSYPVSGTDNVYGLNVARFLADNDEAGQLVLSLYGQLACAMAPGTFVSGEAATIAPVAGSYYRSMYLPPNSVSNAAFLETLRLMLIHERSDRNGNPRELDLAFATPRAWLDPGKQIIVKGAPTAFGPISYSLASSNEDVRASVVIPHNAARRRLRLRLRLPRGGRITQVVLAGRLSRRFDSATGVIDLSGRAGALTLIARYAKR